MARAKLNAQELARKMGIKYPVHQSYDFIYSRLLIRMDHVSEIKHASDFLDSPYTDEDLRRKLKQMVKALEA